jgi:tRNA G37 N-methylase Trm5
MIQKVLPFAHFKMTEVITNEDVVIDGTCGSGHDTLFLSKISKKVYAFDINEAAINQTRERLNRFGYYNNELINDSHENVLNYVKEDIKAAMFYLGYFEDAENSESTQAKSTLKAIQSIKTKLVKGGLIVMVVNVEKFGGKEESEALLNYVHNLDNEEYLVIKYSYLNKNDSPYVIIIEKE